MTEQRIKCDPTSAEMKTAVERVFKLRRRNKIITYSIVFLALGMLLFSTDSLVNLVLGFICVGFAIAMPLIYGVTSLIAVQDTSQQEFMLNLSEKGITFETKHSFFADYESCEAFEDKEIITILAEQSQIFCVPKRCFEEEKDLAQFEETLSQKLEKRYYKDCGVKKSRKKDKNK